MPIPLLVAGGIAAAGLAGSIYSANKQASGARASARAQEEGQRRAIEEQRRAYSDIAPMYAPYSQAGLTGLSGMQGDFTTDMGSFEYGRDVNEFLDPSMSFQQDQMRNQMEQSAVARGGLQSGGFAKALQDRAGQVAQMDYGNAYNRMTQDKATTYQQFMDQFQSRRANNQLRLNQFQNLASMGQNATSGLANLRTGNANQISGNLQNIGTAQGYGAQAGPMAMGQAVGNLTSPQNLMGMYQMYNSLSTPKTGGL